MGLLLARARNKKNKEMLTLRMNYLSALDALHIDTEDMYTLYKCFIKLKGAKETGKVDTDRFLIACQLAEMPFVEQMFSCLDTTRKGRFIEFENFLVTTWNLCTMEGDKLPYLVFDSYDKRGTGLLAATVVNRIFQDIYDRQKKDYSAIAKSMIPAHSISEDVAAEQFAAYLVKNENMLFPVFRMRMALMTTFGGTKFWKRLRDDRNRSQDDLLDPLDWKSLFIKACPHLCGSYLSPTPTGRLTIAQRKKNKVAQALQREEDAKMVDAILDAQVEKKEDDFSDHPVGPMTAAREKAMREAKKLWSPEGTAFADSAQFSLSPKDSLSPTGVGGGDGAISPGPFGGRRASAPPAAADPATHTIVPGTGGLGIPVDDPRIAQRRASAARAARADADSDGSAGRRRSSVTRTRRGSQARGQGAAAAPPGTVGGIPNIVRRRSAADADGGTGHVIDMQTGTLMSQTVGVAGGTRRRRNSVVPLPEGASTTLEAEARKKALEVQLNPDKRDKGRAADMARRRRGSLMAPDEMAALEARAERAAQNVDREGLKDKMDVQAGNTLGGLLGAFGPGSAAHTRDAMAGAHDAAKRGSTTLGAERRNRGAANYKRRFSASDAPASGSPAGGAGASEEDADGSDSDARRRRSRPGSRAGSRASERRSSRSRASADGSDGTDGSARSKKKEELPAILHTPAARRVMDSDHERLTTDKFAETGREAGLKTSLTTEARHDGRRRSAAGAAALQEHESELMTATQLTNARRASAAARVSAADARVAIDRARRSSAARRAKVDAAMKDTGTKSYKYAASQFRTQDGATSVMAARPDLTAADADLSGRGSPALVPERGRGAHARRRSVVGAGTRAEARARRASRSTGEVTTAADVASLTDWEVTERVAEIEKMRDAMLGFS